jgi:hypothetical protein
MLCDSRLASTLALSATAALKKSQLSPAIAFATLSSF